MAYSRVQLVEFVRGALAANPQATLGDISRELGVDRHTIDHALRMIAGEPFRRYRQRMLVNRARTLLVGNGTHSIKEIAYTLGFGCRRSFERAIVRAFGCTPTQMRLTAPVDVTEDLLYKSRVTRMVPLAESVWHLELALEDGRGLRFEAGQSIGVIGAVERRSILRLYSIASCPEEPHARRLDLCVKILPDGQLSTWLRRLQPGDPVTLCGPFGHFGLSEPLDPTIVFVATGTAVAPIRSMLQYLVRYRTDACAPDREVWLFLGARYEDAVLYRDEFEALARRFAWFHFVPTVSRPGAAWHGDVGYVQDQLARYLDGKRGLRVYACGHASMIEQAGAAVCALGHDPYAVVSHGKD